MHIFRSRQADPFRRASPFDLHVLGTPPAFILSQDQTLEKNHPSPEHLAFSLRVSAQFTVFAFTILNLLYLLEVSGLHCCLFAKVRAAFRAAFFIIAQLLLSCQAFF